KGVTACELLRRTIRYKSDRLLLLLGGMAMSSRWVWCVALVVCTWTQSPVAAQEPKTADEFYDRAAMWAKKGEYDKAIRDYDAAIRLEPKFPDAFRERGQMWDAKGEYDKAIDDYTEAIRLYPKFHKAFLARGNAWNAKKEYDKAIADYTEAIKFNPKY